MTEILNEINKIYMVGDVGITEKNYSNWAWTDEHELMITDFAYIYDITSNNFKCSCGGTFNFTDHEFTELQCGKCGKRIEFQDIRNKITNSDQEREIGDIRKRGYVVHEVEQTVPFDPDFRSDIYDRNYQRMHELILSVVYC